MLAAVILHCPELGRDVSALRARVPESHLQLAPRMPHGHDGCILGHQAIVRRAMERGWPAVFVMEDDCEFTEHFSLEQWTADVAWADSHGYNVITGGCISARNPRLVREGLFAVERFKSTHCIAYLQSAYEIVLRVVEPIDVMLGRLGAKCLMTYPFVAVQAPGYSGIQDRVVDYRPRYRRYENELRERACAS